MSLEYVLNTPIITRAPYKQEKQIEAASYFYKVIFVRHLPGGEVSLSRDWVWSSWEEKQKYQEEKRWSRPLLLVGNILLQIHR